MHSEMLLHLRVVPVHVPSCLPSPGFESPAQSCCFGTQHVTVSAGLPQAERDASRRIWAAHCRGTGPQERLPLASGLQALRSRSFLVTQRTWSAWAPGPSHGQAVSISAWTVFLAVSHSGPLPRAVAGAGAVSARQMTAAAMMGGVLVMGGILQADWQPPLSYAARTRASGFRRPRTRLAGVTGTMKCRNRDGCLTSDP